MNRLEFLVPILPPSNNDTYMPVMIKGKPRIVKTDKAKKFEEDLKAYIVQNYINEISEFFPERGSVYTFTIITYFDSVKTKTAGAKHKYKIRDVLWGAKLVQDSISKLLDRDDLYDFNLILKKREGPKGIKVILEEMLYEDLD